jgi:hypothetical protein
VTKGIVTSHCWAFSGIAWPWWGVPGCRVLGAAVVRSPVSRHGLTVPSAGSRTVSAT